MKQKARELRVRVGDLMIVVLHYVTPNDEGSREVAMKTAEGIKKDIKELLRCGL